MTENVSVNGDLVAERAAQALALMDNTRLKRTSVGWLKKNKIPCRSCRQRRPSTNIAR